MKMTYVSKTWRDLDKATHGYPQPACVVISKKEQRDLINDHKNMGFSSSETFNKSEFQFANTRVLVR